MSNSQRRLRSESLLRRAFLKGLGGAMVLGASGKSVGNLLGAAAADEAPVQDAIGFFDYHGVPPAFHRQQTMILPARGLRLVSLSLYDFRSEPQYAAVWLRQSGPAQRFVQDVDAGGFQLQFDTLARGGFKPTVIAATTSTSGEHRFAAVFERTSDAIPLTRHQLVSGHPDDPRTIEHWTRQARMRNWRPTTLTAYGRPDQPLFAGVWEPNPSAIAWNTDGVAETFEDYQRRLDAQVTAWNRPAYVTLSPSGRYLSVFVDDQIGPWIARHGMAKSDYERQRQKFVRQGFFPLAVQAGGTGSAVRYAALFSKRSVALKRRFTLRDSEDLPHNDIDEVMRGMMVGYGIRQAALAVVRGTRLLFTRGYSWAEPGYPLATATTHFRVASCSKVLTAIAVMQLVERRELRLEDRIQDILQLTAPDGGPPTDERFSSVTVGQALTIRSGLRHRWIDNELVVRAFGASLPATKDQIASYHVGQPNLMVGDPGQPDPANLLSNFAYLLVSLVVEQVASGNLVPFWEWVRDSVGGPLGATGIRIATTLVSEQEPAEARYHDDELIVARSVISDDRPLVPLQYGGFNLPVFDAPGGLSVTAVDFARVLAALNLRRDNPMLAPRSIDVMLRDFLGWDFPHGDGSRPRSFHRVKGGLLDGLQSAVNFTQGNQFSYVLYWAKDGLPERNDRPPDPERRWYPEFPALQDAIHRTLDRNVAWDRFPTFGMPTL
jgi:CubicO group peptidase (beta-lactamase class C family)